MKSNNSGGKPRIVVVGPLPPPVGGVETVTAALLDSDLRERFDLVHCNTTKGRPKQTQGKFDLGNLQWALKHFKQLKQAIKDHDPELVYLPIASTTAGFLRDSMFIKILSKAGKKGVGHVHGGDFDNLYNTASPKKKRWIVSTLNKLDTLLPLGSAWEKFFREIGVHCLIRPAPSTLRESVYDAGMAVKRTAEQPERINVLFVGQIGKRKGVFDLLDAARIVHEKNPKVFFNLVGPEEFAGEWAEIMSRYESGAMKEYLQFPGSKSGEELLKAFAEAHLFTLPSYFEGLPVVLFESGAFGLPVVTTPVGAVRDLVEDGKNGFLIEPGDSKALADRILKLADDPILRLQMGEENRERIQAYHPRNVAKKVGDAIEETLSHQKTPASR